MESILTAVKKMLGIEPSYTQFDPDIIMYINAVMLSINQLGVGPDSGFEVTGVDEQWVDLLGDRKDITAVKTLIYLKVRLVFDPPANSFVVEALQRQITELEWRINIQIEKPVVEGAVSNV